MALSCCELVYFVGDSILRQYVKMQPADSAFHAYRARQQVRHVPDARACLLRRDALDGKVSRLAQHVARKLDAALVSYQLAAVASQAALVRSVVVACHGKLEDVSAYYQQAGEVVRVEELPGALAPLAVGVLAYQLADLEVFMKFPYYFVTRLFHRCRLLSGFRFLHG